MKAKDRLARLELAARRKAGPRIAARTLRAFQTMQERAGGAMPLAAIGARLEAGKLTEDDMHALEGGPEMQEAARIFWRVEQSC